MTKEFYSLEEIQKYYNEESNTYIFKEDNKYIELVVLNFNLEVNANIKAYDIHARNINVRDIKVGNIRAWAIKANNIDAYDLDCCDDIVVKNINVCSINAHDIEADDIKTYEDIKAWNIYAHNITAKNIIADNIYAHDISYWGLCFATQNIECHSIKGRRDNHTRFVLDGYIHIDEPIEIISEESLELAFSKCDLKHDGELESGNKALKALKIIKEKNVDIEYIKTCFFDEKGGFKEYNAYVGHDEDKELSQEEYNLLKEVLEQ